MSCMMFSCVQLRAKVQFIVDSFAAICERKNLKLNIQKTMVIDQPAAVRQHAPPHPLKHRGEILNKSVARNPPNHPCLAASIQTLITFSQLW